jgi:hypothetical protein
VGKFWEKDFAVQPTKGDAAVQKGRQRLSIALKLNKTDAVKLISKTNDIDLGKCAHRCHRHLCQESTGGPAKTGSDCDGADSRSDCDGADSRVRGKQAQRWHKLDFEGVQRALC